MKFCTKCNLAIKKSVTSEMIIFKCVCGNIEPSEPDDVLISTGTLLEEDDANMYDDLVKNSPFDPSNTKVMRYCNTCGLDYMTEAKIGPNQNIFYVCKCGNIE